MYMLRYARNVESCLSYAGNGAIKRRSEGNLGNVKIVANEIVEL